VALVLRLQILPQDLYLLPTLFELILRSNSTDTGEKMARTVEIAILNPVEGKTRAQQIVRLKDWKKYFVAEGVEKVVAKEAGPGNLGGQWIFEIHHKSAAAYGTSIDNYFKNPKSYDELMVKWQKAPTFNFASYGIVFEVDEI